MNIIEMNNLSHRFSDGKLGIDSVNLKIEKGEFVVITGQNGSGKTTLIKHLNGLLLPEHGEAMLAGVSVSKDLLRARQLVGLVFQDADSQIVGETVYADVAFGPENLRLDPAEIKRRTCQALKAVGLWEFAEKRPHTLSGGEKRRLTIAGILAMDPQVVVFDEPFSDLDYPGVKQVLEQILRLHQSGRTILVTTHDLEKVIAHADRLIIMKNGKIVRNGPVGDLIKETENFGVREPCASRLGMEIHSWLN